MSAGVCVLYAPICAMFIRELKVRCYMVSLRAASIWQVLMSNKRKWRHFEYLQYLNVGEYKKETSLFHEYSLDPG